MSATWVQQLRELHDGSFSEDYDWSAHLRALNQSLGFVGERELATPARDLPPPWFVGDVEALQPGRWVLVVGLNQKRSRHLLGHSTAAMVRRYSATYDAAKAADAHAAFTPAARLLARSNGTG